MAIIPDAEKGRIFLLKTGWNFPGRQVHFRTRVLIVFPRGENELFRL